jgi:hypothetical protein
MTVLFNTRRAAAHCNLSPRSLEKRRVKGGGPHFLRLGGAVRYQLKDLDLWIASSRRRTTSEKPPAAATSATRSPGGSPTRPQTCNSPHQQIQSVTCHSRAQIDPCEGSQENGQLRFFWSTWQEHRNYRHFAPSELL